MAKAIREMAAEFKKQLAQGINLFGIVDDESNLNASVPSVDGPTAVEIYNRNFFPDRAAGRHFPRPEDYLPRDRG
jgi:hypothetical protein